MPLSSFHHSCFTTFLHDLSLRGFISVIMVLSTISHILINTNPLFLSDVLSSNLSLFFVFSCVHTIYGLNALLCLIKSVSLNMSSRWPVIFIVCSLLHCSVIIGFWMCHVLYIISLPIFVTLTYYDCPLWFALLPSTITPCVHGPQSSLCTTTVDPVGKDTETLWVSLFFKYFSSHIFRAS